MFFNMFKDNRLSMSMQPTPEETQGSEKKIIARITYSFYQDDKSPIIDVELDEYNDECIKALSNIVNTIGEERAYLETIEIIRNAMFTDNQEDWFITLVGNLTHKAKEKMINAHHDSQIDKPCIQPSDML